MLLFGRLPCNLHGCENNLPESNEDSISHHLSDCQRHTEPVRRPDGGGAQGRQPHVLAEEPRRGDALLPGFEDRVAQLHLRCRAGERDALDVDGRGRAEAQHALQRERGAPCGDGEGPLLEDARPSHGNRPEVRAGAAQGLLLPDQSPHVRRGLVHDQAHHEQLRLGEAQAR